VWWKKQNLSINVWILTCATIYSFYNNTWLQAKSECLWQWPIIVFLIDIYIVHRPSFCRNCISKNGSVHRKLWFKKLGLWDIRKISWALFKPQCLMWCLRCWFQDHEIVRRWQLQGYPVNIPQLAFMWTGSVMEKMTAGTTVTKRTAIILQVRYEREAYEYNDLKLYAAHSISVL
jgi:hypothetical protein